MATNTGLKYIICDVAGKKHGKTTFLKLVAKILNAQPGSTTTVLATRWLNDECFVWTDHKTGKTILVQTKGDDAPSFAHTLNYLKNHKAANMPDVDIILCARHTMGQTKKVVRHISTQYNFEELDFTHMYPNNFNWSRPAVGITHNILAKAIYDILMTL